MARSDEVGIGVGDVDTVVLTHLHEDHCGGVVDGSGSPVFPDARHVVQAMEIAALRAEPGPDDLVLRRRAAPEPRRCWTRSTAARP